MKNFKIFEIKGYFTVTVYNINDGRYHSRQLLFVFIMSLQNISNVFFPNF